MSLSSILKSFKSGIDKVGAAAESATKKTIDTVIDTGRDIKQ